MHTSLACPERGVCWGIQGDEMGEVKFKWLFQNHWLGQGEFATLNRGWQLQGVLSILKSGFWFPVVQQNPSWKRISVRRNPKTDFLFYCQIRNPGFEIEIRISQSKAPRGVMAILSAEKSDQGTASQNYPILREIVNFPHAFYSLPGWPGSLAGDMCINLKFVPVGLRSNKAGEQCEAILRFPSLFEKYPFPILINSAFLKLGDVFRNGWVAVRYT